MHVLAWSFWWGQGDEVEYVQDEGLVLSQMAGLMSQMRDEQLAGTPAAGPVAQVKDEQLVRDLAAELARNGAPSRSLESFSQCKMTQFSIPNLARS